MIGDTVSHYKVIEKLGGGGMGVVYKAEDTRLRRMVALKFLPPDLTRDPEAKERFIHEARAASSLDHPNVCTIHEIDETKEGQTFIVMTYYDGETVKKKISRGRMGPEEALDVAIQVCEGLSKAHEKRIIHRDIKPANIMVTADGAAKIVDFGLAKLAGQTKLTRTGTTLGTVAYMSPEQARGEEVDERTDIWSLGVVLYEMLTGQLPFKGDYEQAVIYSILNEEPSPVSSLVPGLTGELQDVIEKALSKNPSKRYQKARELLGALRRIKEIAVASKTPLKTDRIPSKRTRQRHIYMAAAVIVSIAVITLFLAKYFSTERYEKLSPGGPPISDLASDVKNLRQMKSIVVIPFQDISPSGDNEYFSDGLTEEIITDLSKIHSLRVISRTSAMKLKGTKKDVKTIGQELSVGYVLEGSVRKADNDLRITAQLIDAMNDSHIWAEKYTGTMEDVFDIQEKVSRSIVDALKVKLSPEEEQVIVSRPIDNIRAYEYYLRAKKEVWEFKEEALERALEHLQDGLEITGDNVYIYAGMGYVYWQYINAGIKVDEDYLVKAEEYANKIFDMEPGSPYGHLLLGLVCLTKGDWKLSIDHLKKVLAKDPNNTDALRWLVVEYAFMGKATAASQYSNLLMSIDPLSPVSKSAGVWLKFVSGQFDLALQEAETAYRAQSENFALKAIYMVALIYDRRYEAAYTIIDQIAEESPGSYMADLSLFLKHALQGKKVEALAYMTPEFETISKRDWQYSWLVAVAYNLLGEKEKALGWLENSVDRGFVNYPYFNEYDPFLKDLRREKRFKELMERVKHEWENFDSHT